MITPRLAAVIRRRVLINYRVDPVVVRPLLPRGLRPKLIDDSAVAASVCCVQRHCGRSGSERPSVGLQRARPIGSPWSGTPTMDRDTACTSLFGTAPRGFLWSWAGGSIRDRTAMHVSRSRMPVSGSGMRSSLPTSASEQTLRPVRPARPARPGQVRSSRRRRMPRSSSARARSAGLRRVTVAAWRGGRCIPDHGLSNRRPRYASSRRSSRGCPPARRCWTARS